MRDYPEEHDFDCLVVAGDEEPALADFINHWDITNDVQRNVEDVSSELRYTLRSVDKYGDSMMGIKVVVLNPANGSELALGVDDDISSMGPMPADLIVTAIVGHGIAWDGSDWEFYERANIDEKKEISGAITGLYNSFEDALAEHRFYEEEEREAS